MRVGRSAGAAGDDFSFAQLGHQPGRNKASAADIVRAQRLNLIHCVDKGSQPLVIAEGFVVCGDLHRCRPVALEQRVARLPVPMGLDKAGKVQKCGGKIFAAAFVWGGDQPPKFSDEALGRLNGIGTCTGA